MSRQKTSPIEDIPEFEQKGTGYFNVLDNSIKGGLSPLLFLSELSGMLGEGGLYGKH